VLGKFFHRFIFFLSQTEDHIFTTVLFSNIIVAALEIEMCVETAPYVYGIVRFVK
jgi:hypothetical protein